MGLGPNNGVLNDVFRDFPKSFNPNNDQCYKLSHNSLLLCFFQIHYNKWQCENIFCKMYDFVVLKLIYSSCTRKNNLLSRKEQNILIKNTP